MFKYLIYLYTVLTIVRSDCNVCNTASNVACVTENSFKVCGPENVLNPDAPILTCPQGYICDTTAAICSLNTQPACVSGCGKCNENGKFACLNQTTFVLCLGTTTPSSVTGECPNGTVCDITSGSFCKAVTDGETGSCLPNQEVTTATPPTSSSTTYCTTIAKNRGRYPVVGSACKSYIYCYYYGNDLLGRQYNCPGTTLFDPTRQQCRLTYQCATP